jgi:hypothetical protein
MREHGLLSQSDHTHSMCALLLACINLVISRRVQVGSGRGADRGIWAQLRFWFGWTARCRHILIAYPATKDTNPSTVLSGRWSRIQFKAFALGRPYLIPSPSIWPISSNYLCRLTKRRRPNPSEAGFEINRSFCSLPLKIIFRLLAFFSLLKSTLYLSGLPH